MDVVFCKKAKAYGDINRLADGSSRKTFNLYSSIRHNVNQFFVAVVKLLQQMFDCEVMALQLVGYSAPCSAACGIQ